MASELETAAHPENLKRVVIEPVSRVEGHGKVTLLLDADNRVHQVRLHIVEFRGFEKFIQGRPYWEVPVLVQRLCGICPVSHHLAASKALDIVVGARQLTPTAEKMRRLMHLGQILQSHALHFFHLASPDLLFGFDAEVAQRNVVHVAAVDPKVARKGVLLRKYGQEIIRHTAGKRVHGTGSVPGGVNKNLSRAERAELLGEIDTIIAWSGEAVGIIKKLFADHAKLYASFGDVARRPRGGLPRRPCRDEPGRWVRERDVRAGEARRGVDIRHAGIARGRRGGGRRRDVERSDGRLRDARPAGDGPQHPATGFGFEDRGPLDHGRGRSVPGGLRVQLELPGARPRGGDCGDRRAGGWRGDPAGLCAGRGAAR